MAALGARAKNGKLDEESVDLTCERWPGSASWQGNGLKTVHTVAPRRCASAAKGQGFLKQVARLGLKPRLLPGDEEAELAGMGVLSAIPDARGMVADLGGGSLELVQRQDGGQRAYSCRSASSAWARAELQGNRPRSSAMVSRARAQGSASEPASIWSAARSGTGEARHEDDRSSAADRSRYRIMPERLPDVRRRSSQPLPDG